MAISPQQSVDLELYPNQHQSRFQVFRAQHRIPSFQQQAESERGAHFVGPAQSALILKRAHFGGKGVRAGEPPRNSFVVTVILLPSSPPPRCSSFLRGSHTHTPVKTPLSACPGMGIRSIFLVWRVLCSCWMYGWCVVLWWSVCHFCWCRFCWS